MVDHIYVPRGKRAILDALRSKGQDSYFDYIFSSKIAHDPRYLVTLHYGKRYEPWVVDISPTGAYIEGFRKD